MKKTFFRFCKLMVLPMLLGLASCSDSDDSVDNDQVITETDPTSVSDFEPEVLCMASLYVASGVDDYLKEAFSWALSTTESSPENCGVLVLNKLTDVSEEVLQRAIEDEFNNYLICVVDPDKDEFEAYADSHDWFDVEADNVNDSTLIYGFTGANRRYLIQQPVTEEGGDPVLEYINLAQNYYVAISSMISNFDSHKAKGGGDNDNPKTTKMEDFAKDLHFAQTSSTFNVRKQFRQIKWSDPDIFTGSFSMTVFYDIYMVHVFEGEPGSGDYYGVRMTASIASSKMWKGKNKNWHGLVQVRWVGAYCTDFTVESHLGPGPMPTGGDVDKYQYWDEDTFSKIIFPAGGTPSPETTVGSTTYQDKNSFSLSMSQSIGGGSKDSKKGLEGKLSFSQGWEWSHTETREIKDVDIVNERERGLARWRLQFNNLPEYEWSQNYGFNEKNNLAARGTMDLHGSWLWYEKSGKDNEDREPWLICTKLIGKYKIQSFITTKVDLDDTNIERECKLLYQLPKMVNATVGQLKIKNDLPDGMTISNVKVFTASGTEVGTEVYEFKNTVPNGGEQVLGAFNTKYKYIVTFKCKTKDGKTAEYKYTLNPNIELTQKALTTVYASSDFTAI